MLGVLFHNILAPGIKVVKVLNKHKVQLMTPDGEINVYAFISVNEESCNIKISIKFQGKEICGWGKDYLWADAFADLQKQLPKGVLLKCCMTCRHGNMCPYGNTPGKLYCTKDVIITSKDDMCGLFDRTEYRETEARARGCFDICDDYQQQCWDYYTYNDYLYELDK